MRTISLILGAMAAATAVAGCSYDACEEFHAGEQPCPAADGAGGEGGAGGAPQGGGDVGGEGGGGRPPADCIPAEGEPIGAGCGVFVQAGETGNGSQSSPYGTVAAAVSGLGQATRIYICGGETFEGSIELPSDVSIFGGVDCASWRFQATNPKPEILGSADLPAIEISGSGAGTLSFLRVTGADAIAAGGSSVAMLIAQAQTTIQECELTARSGATGAPGEAQPKVVTPGTANGGAGENGCDGTTMTNVGGDPGTNACGAVSYTHLTLPTIERCRSRWSPYH